MEAVGQYVPALHDAQSDARVAPREERYRPAGHGVLPPFLISLKLSIPHACHGIAKQYAGMKILSTAKQHRAFNRQKSSAES